MKKVKITDFLDILEMGTLYFLRSEKNSLKIYISDDCQPKYLLKELPISLKEWLAFLERHNCIIDDYGDEYMHLEKEQCIYFEIGFCNEEKQGWTGLRISPYVTEFNIYVLIRTEIRL